MLSLQFVISILLQVASIVSAADTAAWKSRSIYFVLTDRVARSSSDTGGSSCGNLGNYCGGTVSQAMSLPPLDGANVVVTYSSKDSNQN